MAKKLINKIRSGISDAFTKDIGYQAFIDGFGSGAVKMIFHVPYELSQPVGSRKKSKAELKINELHDLYSGDKVSLFNKIQYYTGVGLGLIASLPITIPEGIVSAPIGAFRDVMKGQKNKSYCSCDDLKL